MKREALCTRGRAGPRECRRHIAPAASEGIEHLRLIHIRTVNGMGAAETERLLSRRISTFIPAYEALH
jgi:hypothetical protein